MRTHALSVAGTFLVALAAWAAPALAQDTLVTVDGSYSGGSGTSDMDRLIDQRLAEARRIHKKRHPAGDQKGVDDKDELQSTLEGIDCGEGDTITVMLMGHATKDSFKFSKASGDDRSLSAQELADWLEGMAIDCRCKIHVVIFSCHSGSFLDELLAKQHIVSAWASSGENELSHSDAFWDPSGRFVDEGDWLKEFLEDWDEVPVGGDEGDALAAGADSGEEEMPIGQWGKQTPTGWRKGTFPVVAHVEAAPAGGKVRIHFWEPKFVRCTTRDLPTTGVTIPAGLANCKWVQFDGVFGPPSDPVTAGGAVTETTPPTENVVAHVEGAGSAGGKSWLVVHVIRPRRAYCKKHRMYVNPATVDPAVQVCTFVDEPVTVLDPGEKIEATGPVAPANVPFRVKVHVEGGRNHDTGEFGAHVLEPVFLRCKKWKCRLPADERAQTGRIQNCENVLIDVVLSSAVAEVIDGSGLRRVHRAAGTYEAAVDVAANVPQPLDFYLETAEPPYPPRQLVPMADVTNTGLNATDVLLRAVIGLPQDAPALRQWLQTGAGNPPRLWESQQQVPLLPPASTAVASFQPWGLPADGGDFWFGFRVQAPGDGVPENDLGELLFSLLPDVPPPGKPAAR
jgi:hypothetical protein